VQRISFILEHLSGTVADVCLTTDLAGLTYRYDQFGAVGSNPVISIGETPLKDWQSFKKAGLDYVAGAILVAIFLPVFALLALAIRLDSRGPILFLQPRLGFNNKMFICYKFRTMYANMTDVMAERQATRGDPRITRVGKLMRKFSLDELSQLINVLNGTMSLVGPRPHPPNTKALAGCSTKWCSNMRCAIGSSLASRVGRRSMVGAARRPLRSRSKTGCATTFSISPIGCFFSTSRLLR
jgi:lipopolysaccharide/colanic/teichoic acid biosynthesis glycosyltransferase